MGHSAHVVLGRAHHPGVCAVMVVDPTLEISLPLPASVASAPGLAEVCSGRAVALRVQISDQNVILRHEHSLIDTPFPVLRTHLLHREFVIEIRDLEGLIWSLPAVFPVLGQPVPAIGRSLGG